MGFCFGGGNVLELARSGADINAVVSLPGVDLQTTMPAKSGDIKAAVFVIPRLKGSGGTEGRPRCP